MEPSTPPPAANGTEELAPLHSTPPADTNGNGELTESVSPAPNGTEELVPRRRKGSSFIVRKVNDDAVPPSLVGLFDPIPKVNPSPSPEPAVNFPSEESPTPSPPRSPRSRGKLRFSPNTKRGSDEITEVNLPSKGLWSRARNKLLKPDSRRGSAPAPIPRTPGVPATPGAPGLSRRQSLRPTLPPPAPPKSRSKPHSNNITPQYDNKAHLSDNLSPVSNDGDPGSRVELPDLSPSSRKQSLDSLGVDPSRVQPRVDPFNEEPPDGAPSQNIPNSLQGDQSDSSDLISPNNTDDTEITDDADDDVTNHVTDDVSDEKRLPKIRKQACFHLDIQKPSDDLNVDDGNDVNDDDVTPTSSCPSLSYRIEDVDTELPAITVKPRVAHKTKYSHNRRFTPAVLTPYNPDDDEDDEKPPGWRGLVYTLKKNNNPTKLFVLILFLMILASVSTIWMFYEKIEYEVEIGREVHFWEDTRTLRLVTRRKASVRLEGRIGKHIPAWVHAQPCPQHIHHQEHKHNRFYRRTVDHLCVHWPGYGKVELRQEASDNKTSCYRVIWFNVHDRNVTDCFRLEAFWYGGPVIRNKTWPLEMKPVRMRGHVTGDFYRDGIGPVLESYWLSSEGVGIFVNESVNLYSSIVEEGGNFSLCLSTLHNRPALPFMSEEEALLQYVICDSVNTVEMQKHVTRTKRQYADRVPDNLREPSCSSWGSLGTNVTQAGLERLIEEIEKFDLNCSQLVVYGEWEQTAGDMTPDPEKFPNITSLLDRLNARGVALSFPLHPFIDVSAVDLFEEAARDGHLIRAATDDTPALVEYSGMSRKDRKVRLGGVVNMIQEKTRLWFLERIVNFQAETNIPAVHFTMGHVTWLPRYGRMNESLFNPSEFTHQYASLAAGLNATTIPFAYRNQDLDSVIYIPDRNATWSRDKGLASVIPSILDLAIKGYRFPSLRVGSGLDLPGNTTFPDKELYIRTLALSVFLPSFELSVMPWRYDNETQEIVRRFLALRREYVSPVVLRLAAETNASVVRPLWMADVNDSLLFAISDQFMLGADILVAPVVTPGHIGRDVYLPSGRWLDRNLHVEVTGGRWLRRYAVPLRGVAYFERIETRDEHEYAPNPHPYVTHS